ncbi:hypothetical protein [Halobellus sp. GM3]|uniref:hypothetical protein n=1 Tax=Halobellus sp. GM3 TaxID=3458410 RepID=UPI00403E2B01
MSHRNRGQNLSEWADLVGASLPESIEEVDNGESRSDARERVWSEFGSDTRDHVQYEFGSNARRDG